MTRSLLEKSDHHSMNEPVIRLSSTIQGIHFQNLYPMTRSLLISRHSCYILIVKRIHFQSWYSTTQSSHEISFIASRINQLRPPSIILKISSYGEESYYLKFYDIFIKLIMLEKWFFVELCSSMPTRLAGSPISEHSSNPSWDATVHPVCETFNVMHMV